MKKHISTVLSFIILGILAWGSYWIISTVWGQFKLLDPKVSISLLTGATTVIAATLAVVLGKYFERKRDIEAHYREKKIQIYDEFLCEFFKLFNSEYGNEESQGLVSFLREWQRKMILWGGQDVLSKYIAWKEHMQKNKPNAKTMFMMEEFFLEIRKDLGHKNNKLVKGTFIYLILQNAELFLRMAKDNPDLTLEELVQKEKCLANS
ncbi:hypothetical protein LO80_03650 [Candidatus Francisella endociliophora]|uniref:Uncharacterized protein n=1 Tax=Candidatus Francisella endociliophora TaxID=653937 RepID=A0A097ENK8_9GAMM|nr:hypothetical protein [Francisella sp. FSC1006]AIT09151.1 hypothetical protein LO80_03650 [Francisella sp. FSC1006]